MPGSRFGFSLDVAIEHGVPTCRRFRRIIENAGRGEEGEDDKDEYRGSRIFKCCADLVDAILAMDQTEV